MEPTLKPAHIAGVVVLLVVASLRGPTAASSFLADYAIALICIVVGLQAYYRWLNYRSVRNLEAIDYPERRFYLSFVHHPDQLAAIERDLAHSHVAARTGAELFLPSPALRGFLEWPFWVGVAIGIGVLVARLLGAPLAVWHWLIATVAVTMSLYAWLRLQTLRHYIEISPFGITEIYPDGRRRALRWPSVAGLRPLRWRRVVKVLPVAGPGYLAFSYDTTRIGRLVELIVSHAEAAARHHAS